MNKVQLVLSSYCSLISTIKEEKKKGKRKGDGKEREGGGKITVVCRPRSCLKFSSWLACLGIEGGEKNKRRGQKGGGGREKKGGIFPSWPFPLPPPHRAGDQKKTPLWEKKNRLSAKLGTRYNILYGGLRRERRKFQQ